jgi:carbon storage regulator CsrA
MLQFCRKPGEKLIIGEDVIVTVLAVNRGRVQLGFNCPPYVKILRAELARRRDDARELDLEKIHFGGASDAAT